MKFQDMDKDQESELLAKVFHMNTGHPRNPPNPPLEKGGEGGISGIAWLQESALWTGVLLSYMTAFPFLFFFLRIDPCSSVFIRVPIKAVRREKSGVRGICTTYLQTL